MADLYCTQEELPEFVAIDCGGDEAGIIGVGFLEPEVNFNGSPDQLSQAAFWQSLVDASPKQAYIIKNTRGEYPKAAVTESEGFGRKSTQVTGRDHEVTFEVPGIKDNVVFFNRINRRTDLLFSFVTNGDLVHFVKVPVSIDAGIQIDRDIKAWEFFAVTVKWSDFDLPIVEDAPDGIFD